MQAFKRMYNGKVAKRIQRWRVNDVQSDVVGVLEMDVVVGRPSHRGRGRWRPSLVLSSLFPLPSSLFPATPSGVGGFGPIGVGRE